jgi:hypothetical protein
MVWDGAVWSVVSSPNVGSGNNRLESVSCVSVSDCVAVGDTWTGSVYKTLVMVWDGAVWSVVSSPNVGSGNNRLESVSCVSVSDCVAVGDSWTGSVYKTLVMVWDGAVWSVVSSPNVGSNHNQLYSVSCVSVSDCVAVGYTDTGSVDETLVMVWDGTVWSVVSSPNVGSNHNQLYSVSCVSVSDCVAVGDIEIGEEFQNMLVMVWDGAVWSVVSSPDVGSDDHWLQSVSCVSASECVAAGSYDNGPRDETLVVSLTEPEPSSAISVDTAVVVSSPNVGTGDNELNSVSCVSATECVAVGETNTGSATETLVMVWDGAVWSVVSSPNVGSGTNDNALYSVSCVSVSDCVAVGNTYTGSVWETLAMVWDGAVWSVVPSPSPGTSDDELYSVSCVSASDCVAVGYTYTGFVYETLVMEWDGAVWSVVSSPNVGSDDNELYSVSCVSVSDCVAVGSWYNNEVDVDETLVMVWDGNVWSVVSSPNVGSGNNENYLNAVSCVSVSDCVAVGYTYNDEDDVDETLVMVWDGNVWSVVSSPDVGSVSDNELYSVSCVSVSDCVAVGYTYYDDDEDSAWETLVMVWDGVEWSVLSSPNVGSDNDNELNSVSCVSAYFCVGAGGYYNDSVQKTLVLSLTGPEPVSTTTTTEPLPTATTAVSSLDQLVPAFTG